MLLPALPVVAPLFIAALLAGAGSILSRRILDTVACLTSASVMAICALLTLKSRPAPIVYWFGHWRPEGHFPVGISFVIDPIGAGLATFVALLVLAAFVFSWHYFESVKSLYHAVMLVFLAAMCGLCLTGDLFNLFVWFELMSAAGIVLCGYMAEETGPLQGALNFAITNTIGAYLSLTGLALLYAQTGALNFAEVGHSLLAHHPGGRFVAIAFLFISAGFLIKAASFPFQLWLPDAHAVAPTPVCILFSGAMVELGLYAVARMYWTVFAGAIGSGADTIRTLFLIIGALTALVGAIQCFGQRHLKRLLACSTISHIGVMLIGFGLLLPKALAGTALYVVGHGLAKATLFICAGMLLHRFQSVDEYELQGKGQHLPGIGLLMLAGAIGLAGLPTFANFYGEEMIDVAAHPLHAPWIPVVVIIAGLLTVGAILRVAGRIFLGWGQQPESATEGAPKIPMKRETEGVQNKTPFTMWLPALVLIVISMIVVPVGHLREPAISYVERMENFPGYMAAVLNGASFPPPHAAAEPSSASSIVRQILLLLGSILLALAALFPNAIGEVPSRAFGRIVEAFMWPFRAIQSGKVGDYVTWIVLGMAAYGMFLLSSFH